MTIFKVPHAWPIEPLDEMCAQHCRMQSVSCPNRWTLLYVSWTSPAFSCSYENCRQNPASSHFSISLPTLRGNQWLFNSDMHYRILLQSMDSDDFINDKITNINCCILNTFFFFSKHSNEPNTHTSHIKPCHRFKYSAHVAVDYGAFWSFLELEKLYWKELRKFSRFPLLYSYNPPLYIFG